VSDVVFPQVKLQCIEGGPTCREAVKNQRLLKAANEGLCWSWWWTLWTFTV